MGFKDMQDVQLIATAEKGRISVLAYDLLFLPPNSGQIAAQTRKEKCDE
jgi:hypothetical protein